MSAVGKLTERDEIVRLSVMADLSEAVEAMENVANMLTEFEPEFANGTDMVADTMAAIVIVNGIMERLDR